MNKIPPLTPENIRERDRLIRELSPKAHPNNIYWHRIVALQGGESADYDPKDEGMHWSDLNDYDINNNEE